MKRWLVLCLLMLNSACGARMPGGKLSPKSCTSSLEEGAARLLKNQAMPLLTTVAMQGEGAYQFRLYGGRVCPLYAMSLAVGALLRDTGPESLQEICRSQGDRGQCGAQKVLAQREAIWGLVADRRSDLRHQRLPLPPGSWLSTHWVFFLSVPSLSAHNHWALVSRSTGTVEIISEN